MVPAVGCVAKSRAGKGHPRGGCKIRRSRRTERIPEARENIWKVNPQSWDEAGMSAPGHHCAGGEGLGRK